MTKAFEGILEVVRPRKGQKNVLLATIPHTGTRFFADLIYRAQQANGFRHVGFAIAHLVPQNRQEIDKFIELYDPLICTTERDATATADSWAGRSEEICPLQESLDYAEQFKAHHNPIIVSIDSGDRDAKLQTAAAAFGETITTDWAVVGNDATP